MKNGVLTYIKRRFFNLHLSDILGPKMRQSCLCTCIYEFRRNKCYRFSIFYGLQTVVYLSICLTPSF